MWELVRRDNHGIWPPYRTVECFKGDWCELRVGLVVGNGTKVSVRVDLGPGAFVGVRWIGPRQWGTSVVVGWAHRGLLPFGR